MHQLHIFLGIATVNYITLYFYVKLQMSFSLKLVNQFLSNAVQFPLRHINTSDGRQSLTETLEIVLEITPLEVWNRIRQSFINNLLEFYGKYVCNSFSYSKGTHTI